MSWNVVEGNWAQYKGYLKAQRGNLTNDRLDVIAGKRDQLAGRIQNGYGVYQDDADKQRGSNQMYLKISRLA